MVLSRNVAQQNDGGAASGIKPLQMSQQISQADLTDADRIWQRQQLGDLLEQLRTSDFQGRWDAAKQIAALGAIAVDPLLDLLRDERQAPEARWFAARALGNFDQPPVIASLAQVLRDTEDEDLSQIAAAGLANLQAVAVLATLLDDPKQRLLAVQSLAQIGTSDTVEPLLQVVSDPDPAIRQTALDALGRIGDSRVGPILIAALADPVAAVRQLAVQTLGRRPTLAGRDLVGHLQLRLQDEDLAVRRTTLTSLGHVGTPAAISLLGQVVHHPHTPPSLQIRAIEVLGWLNQPESHGPLATTLTHPEVTLRQAAATALGKLTARAEPATASLLTHLFQTPETDPAVQQAAALALARLGQPAAWDGLVALAQSAHAGVQLHGISALKQLDRDRGRQVLAQLSQSDMLSAPVRQGLVMALATW
jgi:HEAT repeat protein